jgi:5-amino-6-(D-ribitylamino)uracil---L-tyrosine 4-hydroxyphenyl transferase
MIDAILDRALMGQDLTPAEGVVLLQQRDPQAIAQIRVTADRLRQMQVGETVTYVVNRNLNFTNFVRFDGMRGMMGRFGSIGHRF